MGIEINKPGTGETVEVDRRLWLTADRQRVVEDGDPQAAFLYATAGARVPRAEAEELGALPAKSARKQAERAEDKQAAPAANKATKRRAS